MVVVVPVSVVESVAEVVFTSPIPVCVAVWRESVDVVSVVVRTMVVEACRSVMVDEPSVAWSDAWSASSALDRSDGSAIVKMASCRAYSCIASRCSSRTSVDCTGRAARCDSACLHSTAADAAACGAAAGSTGASVSAGRLCCSAAACLRDGASGLRTAA